MNGNVHEYVFDSRCKNTDNMLSRLDWDVQNISYIGLNASFSIFRYIYTDASFQYGFSKDSGNMQDYDWQNSTGGSVLWRLDNPNQLTNYSIHQNNLDAYYNFQCSLGGNIHLPFSIVLTPFIAYEYEHISFTGSNGSGHYKNQYINTKFDDFVFSGKVISYKQESNSIFLGLNVFATLFSKIDILTNVQFSPALTFFTAKDNHYVKNQYDGTVYIDKPEFAYKTQAKLYINYNFNKHNSLGLNCHIQYVPVSKGRTYMGQIDTNGNLNSDRWSYDSHVEGALSRFLWSIGINYTFTF